MSKPIRIIFVIYFLATAYCFSQNTAKQKQQITSLQVKEFKSTKKLDSAIVAENRILAAAKSSKKLEETIYANLRLSDYYLQKGKGITAGNFAKAALRLAQEDKYAKVQLHCYLILAKAEQLRGKAEKSREYFATASTNAQRYKLENRDAIDALVGQALNSDGTSMEKDSTATRSAKYFADAITLAEKSHDQKALNYVATIRDNLALSQQNPDFTAVAKRFQMAREYYESQNDISEMSRLHLLFANLYERKGNERAAIAYHSANVKLNNFEGNDIALTKANNEFAKYLTRTGKLAPASALFSAAHSIMKSAGADLSDLSSQTKTMSSSYALAKNYKSAYETLQLYNDIELKIAERDLKTEDSLARKSVVAEKEDEEVKLLPIPQQLTEKDTDTQKDLFFVLVIFALGAVTLLYMSYRKKSQGSDDQNRINVLKSRFLKNISQEFITPLTLMKQPLEHLRSSMTNDDQKEQIAKLSDTTEEVLRLVDQLIHISKIESGNAELQVETGDIFRFIETTVAPFATEARAEGNIFISNVDQSEEKTTFDAAVLKNIISILLANAFHYSNDKGPIYFSAIKEKKYLKLGFSHNSGKLTKREVDRLFEQFSSHVEDKNGSGIGLELVKNLIKIYCGRIETKLTDTGLSFTVMLPWDLKEVPKKNRVGVNKPKKKLLLVAADDKRDRNEILLMLENEYIGIETDNGATALTLAKQRRPDAIVSYQKLHDMDGDTLAKCIKSDPETVSIPVILISSARDSINNFGNASVADASLSAPINSGQLRSYLQEFVIQKV